jgi:preprotein translocase subunit Sec63
MLTIFKSSLFVTVGWVAFAVILVYVLRSTSNITVYDPFTILGISPVSMSLDLT